LEEKTIVLDQINYQKENPSEAIGVSEEEIEKCKRKLLTNHKGPRDLLEKLGLSEDELCQAINELLATDRVVITKSPTKVIANLWKKRSRKEITLVEYVGTSILIAEALIELQKKGEIEMKIVVGSGGRNKTIYV